MKQNNTLIEHIKKEIYNYYSLNGNSIGIGSLNSFPKMIKEDDDILSNIPDTDEGGFNNTNKDVYSIEDWDKDGSLKLNPGQLVSDDVIEELSGSVPPMIHPHRTIGGLFQAGEPYTSSEDGKSLYHTFRFKGDNTWEFIGDCYAGTDNVGKEFDFIQEGIFFKS